MPCLPFLALGLAYTSNLIYSQIKINQRKFCFLLFSSAVFLQMVFITTAFTINNVVDTRIKIGDWLNRNLPANTKVLVDWFPYGPKLPDNSSIRLQMFEAGKFIPFLKDVVENKVKPDGDYLVLSSLVYDRFFSQPNADQYRRKVIEKAFKTLKRVKEIRPNISSYGFHNPALTLFSLNSSNHLSDIDQKKGVFKCPCEQNGKFAKKISELIALPLWD
jgi:hypothetical protein